MSLKKSLLLAALGVAWCAGESRAAFVSETNAFDRLAIDVNRDGVTGDGLGGNGSITAGNEEFFEFNNNSGVALNLNGWVFKDTNLAAPTSATDTTTTSYDFAFGPSTGVSLASNQAMIMTVSPFTPNVVGSGFVPRNFGGSILYHKDQTFVTASINISNGVSLTGKAVTYNSPGTAAGFGTTNDAVVAYDPASLPLASVGPTLAIASSPQASTLRTGDVPAGAAIAHPTLGSANASPGIKANGTSWVTPEQLIAKIAGDGTVTGTNNAWTVDFGTVVEGTPLSVTLALGNSAGLGGVLRAVGDATATGDATITTGASQTLSLLGGESTNNYGALGTINGYNYSDAASAQNLTFTIDTSAAGLVGGTYSFNVRDGFSIVNGAAASPLLEGGQLTISFTAEVTAIPEPSSIMLGTVGLLGLVGYRLRRRS